MSVTFVAMAYDIAVTGRIIVERPNCDELSNIKAGANEYHALLAQADQLGIDIEKAFAHSNLPETPNEQATLSALVQVREQLYIYMS